MCIYTYLIYIYTRTLNKWKKVLNFNIKTRKTENLIKKGIILNNWFLTEVTAKQTTQNYWYSKKLLIIYKRTEEEKLIK